MNLQTLSQLPALGKLYIRYKLFPKIADNIKNSKGKALLYLFLGLYALYVALKHNGLLPKKSVRGEHIFITGAGSGLGRQMAFRFARLGAKISVTDVNLEGAKKVEEEIVKRGGEAVAIFCDVGRSESVKEAAETARAKFGEITILINNAGIVSGKKLLQNTEKMIEKTIQVNTVALHYTTREFLPSMIKANKGHVVNVASIAGHAGVNGLADYCASKFGAVGFDESLRMELRSMGSRVKTTCICPYYINTGMFDGVKSRMPWLLPILSEDYASRRIVNAILQEEPITFLPFSGSLLLVLKSTLPTSWCDFLSDIVGANSSMDEFKGRH